MRFHWSIDKRPVIWQHQMWPTKSGRQWQDLCKNIFELPGEKLNRLPDVRFLPVFFCIPRYKLILDNTNITTEKLVWTIYHFVSVITWVLQLLSIAMSTNDQPLHIQVCPDPDWGSGPGLRLRYRVKRTGRSLIILFRSFDEEYALVNFIRSSAFVFNPTWNYFPAYSGIILKINHT